jgi:hypothetical protein
MSSGSAKGKGGEEGKVTFHDVVDELKGLDYFVWLTSDHDRGEVLAVGNGKDDDLGLSGQLQVSDDTSLLANHFAN